MVRKLKAWLKKNYLTPEENDFNAIVESFGSINPDGVIAELVADGMELKPETVRDVVSRYNRKCIDMVLRGYNVNTGIVYMHTTIKGVFYDKTWNPERNHLHVVISQGTDLRAAVAETTVEIMGEHPDPIALFSITDLSTGKTDGTLTLGFNAELKGTYIKIAGDDDSCGIYLSNIDTAEETKIAAQYIAVNDPSRILIIVPPTLAAGSYELRVVTQFTGANKTLNKPRSVTLSYTVVIG
jgi:hypothetical protein